MDRNELTQLLTEAFKEYEYWHVPNLRARVKQPDAYIREVLKEIADYIPAGDFAGTFRLNNDTRNALNLGTRALGAGAPKVEPKMEEYQSEMDVATEDDDDNLEMEDVKP